MNHYTSEIEEQIELDDKHIETQIERTAGELCLREDDGPLLRQDHTLIFDSSVYSAFCGTIIYLCDVERWPNHRRWSIAIDRGDRTLLPSNGLMLRVPSQYGGYKSTSAGRRAIDNLPLILDPTAKVSRDIGREDRDSIPSDGYKPSRWFREREGNGIPAARLRMAAERKVIRTVGEGRQKRYCVEDVRRLWPEDMPPDRKNA